MNKKTSIIIKRLRASYLSSLLSIALVLILVGTISIIAANAKNVADYFKENMVISVILKQSVTETQAQNLSKEMQDLDFVKSAAFVSKEQGENEMKALLGEDFLNVFESSPIPFSIDLHLDGDMVSKDSLNFVKAKILENSKVEEVTYQESLVEMMNANMTQIGLILAVVVALLMFVSFVLISNTVRLNVFSKRFTIHTMRLVGAKKIFICKPFVIRAMILGAVSGVVASVVIAVTLMYSGNNIEFLKSIFNMQLNYMILLGVIILGVIICGISAAFVTNKLVDMSKDELYF